MCLTGSDFIKGKRGLLIIAHPDDEVMFFTPLLLSGSRFASFSILCLSCGNADGIGEIRRKELIKSAQAFDIEESDVYIIDHPQLQDGMKNDWNIDIICTLVSSYLQLLKPDVVFTFDEYGVSYHPNHIATFQGTCIAVSLFNSKGYAITGLKLQTTNVVRKFCGIVDLCLSFLFNSIQFYNFNLLKVYEGMCSHASQFVWYRKIFIVLSRYSYVNSFIDLKDKYEKRS